MTIAIIPCPALAGDPAAAKRARSQKMVPASMLKAYASTLKAHASMLDRYNDLLKINISLYLIMMSDAMLAEEGNNHLTAARRAAETVNSSAFDIYKDIAEANKGRDILFSPVNLSAAFAMFHLVTESQDIRDEIARIFHFADTVHADMPELMRLIKDSNKYTEKILNIDQPGQKRGFGTLEISNVLWSPLGNRIKNSDSLAEDYDIGVKYIDFNDNSVAFINHITNKISGGNISHMAAKGDVPENTKMLFTNAVYFNYFLQNKFPEGRHWRSESVFHIDRFSEAQIPVMKGAFLIPYYENTDYQTIEIPFIHNIYSMIIILPREKDGFGALEKTIDIDMLHWIKEHYAFSEVLVTMPIFNIRKPYGRQLEIPDNLKRVVNRMDSKIINNEHIVVDGKGAMPTDLTGFIFYNSAFKNFNARHPFLFLIKDSRSGAILLMGRFTGESE
jgi:serpin B